MLRRIRAVIATSLLWAIVWSPVGAVVGLVQYLTRPSWALIDVVPPPPGLMLDMVVRFSYRWGLLGAISGAAFATVLALAERNTSVATLSLIRVSIWGALGALLLPAGLVLVGLFTFPLEQLSINVVPLISIATLGALCAAATLTIARRSPAARSYADDSAA
jgi:hypothetical protein